MTAVGPFRGGRPVSAYAGHAPRDNVGSGAGQRDERGA